MKKFLYALVLLFVVVSCKETPPPIDFGIEGVFVLKDTTYSVSEAELPSDVKRGVLIEDLTGVRCVACPNADTAAQDIKENLSDIKVVILGLFPQSPNVLTFPIDNNEDLRTETAELVGENLFNFSNILPAGGVNRVVPNGESTINHNFNQWANTANSFVGQSAQIDLEITTNFVNDSTLEIQSKSTILDDLLYTPFITIMVLEDDLVVPQYYSGGTNDSYPHNHVVRYAVTPYNGSELLEANTNPERGVVVEKGWRTTIPHNIDLDKASVAAFINFNDADSKEVIQCTESKLR